jgi:hypothetical protein
MSEPQCYLAASRNEKLIANRKFGVLARCLDFARAARELRVHRSMLKRPVKAPE